MMSLLFNLLLAVFLIDSIVFVVQAKNDESNFKIYKRDFQELIRKSPELFQNTGNEVSGSDKFSKIPQSVSNIAKRKSIADKNLSYLKSPRLTNQQTLLGDGEVVTFNPGDQAQPFTLYTLNGKKLTYPGSDFTDVSTIFHVFDPDSAFLECLWMSNDTLIPLFNDTGFANTQLIFIAKSAELEDKFGPKWMQLQLQKVFDNWQRSSNQKKTKALERFHFAAEPLVKLGNWLPSVFSQWQCVDHLCGLDQVMLQSQGEPFPTVLKRLDARYDWLPNPASLFGNKTLNLVYSLDGCEIVTGLHGVVALVTESTKCTYFDQITHMQASGAVAVVIMAEENQPIRDLRCEGSECTADLHIPASMIPYNKEFLDRPAMMAITYQNTPSDNFFMALTSEGRLAEVGWFLYPTMNFLMWQAQWFMYENHVKRELEDPDASFEVFHQQIMQGNDGVVANVTFFDLQDLHLFQQMELDLSLSCPGTRDTTCAHWDHTVNLYICCNESSPLCGMELGRWITPFRRRIGRWLTDVSPLMPLITSKTCTFTLKTAPWAMPWVPSLNIRFQKGQSVEGIYPAEIIPLYHPGATFDKNYNTHFTPYKFIVPNDVVQVQIFAVITGHGSDENGCGEFCVTSHHFMVNNVTNNITFSDAGTPLGCANQVLTGVEPNEHGTWLYGRNGWCDGRNVFPWVINVTDQILPGGAENTLRYFGWFLGKDPDPKHNPGEIILYSYLVYYKKIMP